jgi:hypothetical protein
VNESIEKLPEKTVATDENCLICNLGVMYYWSTKGSTVYPGKR